MLKQLETWRKIFGHVQHLYLIWIIIAMFHGTFPIHGVNSNKNLSWTILIATPDNTKTYNGYIAGNMFCLSSFAETYVMLQSFKNAACITLYTFSLCLVLTNLVFIFRLSHFGKCPSVRSYLVVIDINDCKM